MWCLILVLGTFSGPVISQTDDVAISSSLESHVFNNLTDNHEAKRKMSRQLISDGCPSEIPITENGKFVAARLWIGPGNDFPELSCNGAFGDWNSGIKWSAASEAERIPVGSIFVNPGCLITIFQGVGFTGLYNIWKAGRFPKISKGFDNLDNLGFLVAVVGSFLVSCQQTYPNCTFTDDWVTVAEIDNSESSLSTTFTYEKTVGTTFSSEIKKSQSVSTTVSASVSAAFWAITAKIGVSHKTNHDWSKTDTTTKSESTSSKVQVDVPPGVTMSIQDAVGTCGGSTIHTQLFRIVDSKTKKVVKTMQGRVDKHSLSREDFL